MTTAVILGDLVERVDTADPKRGDGTTFRYVDIGAVDQSLKRIRDVQVVSRENAPSRARQVLGAGDVLVSTVRPNLNAVAFVADEFSDSIASTGFTVLRAKSDLLDGRYLFHWTRSDRFVADMERRATGASYPAVSDAIVKASRIPLPPIEEQRRIAAILDHADELNAKRRASLALLGSVTASIFVEIFGDPAANEMGWPTRPIEDLCRLVRGSSPRPKADPRFYGGNVPRLMVADITRDGTLVTPRIDTLTAEGAKMSRRVQAGTVVMVVSGDVGVVSQLAVDACVHDGFVAFTDLDGSSMRPEFLLTQLQLSKARHRKNTAGAIFQNLTTVDIKALQLVVPPVADQDRFLSYLSATSKLRDECLTAQKGCNKLFASLHHRAFAGTL